MNRPPNSLVFWIAAGEMQVFVIAFVDSITEIGNTRLYVRANRESPLQEYRNLTGIPKFGGNTGIWQEYRNLAFSPCIPQQLQNACHVCHGVIFVTSVGA